MPFRMSSNVWLVLGASLAVSGGFVVVVSVLDRGPFLWVGVGLVAAGSLALRKGLNEAQGKADEGALAAVAAPSASRVEAELRRPAPRKVAMTTRGKAVVFVWMFTLALFATLAYEHFARLPPPESKDRLESEGVEAVAEIHALEARSLNDQRTLYFVGYSFPTRSGSPTRVNRSIPARVFDRLAEGQRTPVVYFPGTPELHYLPDLTSPLPTRLVFFLGGLLLAAAGFAESQRRLHRRLVARGTPIAGLIADVRRRGGVRSFLVNYEIGGVRASLKARERNPDLKNGQTATVLYDPSASNRAIIYRLALYRARS